MAAVNPICSVHGKDLLALFCKDCDRPLCCDCVTRDHGGHKLCNVSEVVEFHQQELNAVLKNEESIQFLERLVVDSQREQNRLAQHTEDLLRNVMDREEELISKVRIWRENMMDTIIQFREKRDKCLEERQSTVSALFNMRGGGFHHESESSKLEITCISCEVRYLLADKTNSSDDETCYLIKFEIGPSSSDLNDMFGKLSENEMSSDEIPVDEAEKANEMEVGEDDEEFYECEDLHRYKFRAESINDIIPLQNHHAFLLSSDTVYLCDFKKDDCDAKPILSNVHQIAHIPTSGDALCVMKGYKEIKRISKGNIVTSFLYTIQTYVMFTSVCSGGNEAYACVSQRGNIQHWYSKGEYSHEYRIYLFNESGVVLKGFAFGSVSNFDDLTRLMKTMNKNCYLRSKSYIVELIDFQQCKKIKTYKGSVGPNPESRFCTTRMTTDNENNILLAVQNDNAIHLLDSSLTFQKLLMTAEDGLHGPSSVALDRDGYLWVGCEDGQLHVVNYQYLLKTDRQARLKLTQTITKTTKSVQRRIGWWWWG